MQNMTTYDYVLVGFFLAAQRLILITLLIFGAWKVLEVIYHILFKHKEVK